MPLRGREKGRTRCERERPKTKGVDEMIMPFGKHRGKPIETIPLDYLVWVLNNCAAASPALRAEISRVLAAEAARQESLEADQSRGGWLSFPALAERWYRALAMEFHPDRGGSHDAMKAVNRGRDLLLQFVKEAAA